VAMDSFYCYGARAHAPTDDEVLDESTLTCPIMANDGAIGFRVALSTPGVRAFTSAGLIARLPIAMIALATVLLVSNQTGSYAYAGLLSALFALTAALVSIGTSRWADAVGQTRVLRVLAVSHSSLLIAFTSAIVLRWPTAVQILLVMAAGASSPAIGSFVRARWAALKRGPETARIGFAWESILDEVIFTIGPLITTFVAFGYGFATPLWIAAGLVGFGSLWLSCARRTTPPVHTLTEHSMSFSSVLKAPGLRPVVVSALGLGTLFGSLDVGVVAFTAEQGTGTFTGIVLAAFAATSMVGGVLYGIRSWPGGVVRQTQAAAAALVLVMLSMPLVPNNLALTVVAALAGFCVAPALIGLFTMASALVPPRHVTEGLTWTNSGLAAGFATGSALGGILIDSLGTRYGLVLGLVGALLAASAVWSRARTLTSAYRPSQATESAIDAVPLNDDPVPGPHPSLVRPALDSRQDTERDVQ